MDEDVRTIYLFNLSKHNSGSYAKVYCICCEVVDALNNLGITNRKSKKPFKHPNALPNNPRSLEGRTFKTLGRLHKKTANMVKETTWTTE